MRKGGCNFLDIGGTTYLVDLAGRIRNFLKNIWHMNCIDGKIVTIDRTDGFKGL